VATRQVWTPDVVQTLVTEGNAPMVHHKPTVRLRVGETERHSAVAESPPMSVPLISAGRRTHQNAIGNQNAKQFHCLIQRAAHGQAAALEDVGVDLGRFDVFVTEQLLYSTNVVAIFQ